MCGVRGQQGMREEVSRLKQPAESNLKKETPVHLLLNVAAADA
jgi:hypothetical protein